MTIEHVPRSPLAVKVQAADIRPMPRKGVALRLAEIHDTHNGLIAITMRELAQVAELSVNQVRRHVHGLISDGVLVVVSHAHGGDPSQAPRYRFSTDRLEELAHALGGNRELFEPLQVSGAPDAPPELEAVLWPDPDTEIVARLSGPPGQRVVALWVNRDRPRRYGSISLRRLLISEGPFVWDGVLTPINKPHCQERDLYRLPPKQIAKLAQWAQNAALGRIESVPA